MKAKIDKESCIGCGICESTCPEVFKMGDDGTAEAIDQEIAETLMDSANEAKDSCPVECISIE